MMVFIPLLCILSLAFAEPPVGDGYPSARSSHHHSHDHNHEHDHTNDFQRSLLQEYGAPAARAFGSTRNALSTEYGPPSARTANSRSSLSQSYGLPDARSGISQEYGVPSAKSSPASRGLSTEYGVPNVRSGPSQLYGAPAARSTLSQEYGVPSAGSDYSRTPSGEYGVPSQRNFDGTPSQKYGPPAVVAARSGNMKQSNSSPRNFAAFYASSGRAASAARSSKPRSQNTDTLSHTYGAPSQRDLSDTYGVPSAGGVSQEYGVPASRSANQKSNTIASPHSAAAARSPPSDTYGVPSARDSMPSEQYGVPDQYSNLSEGGYSYARNGANDVLNEEPASYDFAYKVEDYESGSDFGHTETRQDNRAEGAYFVVLPDGTKQVVEYEADERGFKPRISVEPADLSRSGGYDDNAAELGRSSDGPY